MTLEQIRERYCTKEGTTTQGWGSKIHVPEDILETLLAVAEAAKEVNDHPGEDITWKCLEQALAALEKL